MFRKKIILVVFLALVAVNTVFSQAVAIDAALSNAAINISERVPNGTRIAVLNISSDYANLSDYIINELIVNLVNAGTFQVVPRSTVELELVNREFDFQMTGFVSDESQKSLGQFLGAGTIISGSVTRDSGNTYRLIINAIHVESFTFQSSFRASIQNDRQLVTLTDGVFFEDYTVGQRLGMGALNMFFGLGSILNGHQIGWVITGTEVVGIAFVTLGLALRPYVYSDFDLANHEISSVGERNKMDQIERNERRVNSKRNFVIAGSAAIGAGVLFGYIVPFFHHKPNNTNVSQNTFPFGVELVSSNNQGINGVRLLYNISY